MTTLIALIPLLIAVLTETFKKIHMRSDLEWKFSRAKLIQGTFLRYAKKSCQDFSFWLCVFIEKI